MLRIAKEYPDASDLAFLHAELGDTSYTKRFIAAHQDQTSNTLLDACFLPKMRAALALFARRPMEAVTALEWARLYGKREYSILTQRAAACMQAGKADLAANEYQAILAAASGTDVSSPLYNLAHVRLAHVYAAEGKKDESREEYAKFFELSKDADKDAPVLLQARMSYRHLSN